MSPANLLELAIIAFIVIGIGVAIWRGGAKNPVGTGSLDRKLTRIGTQLNGVEQRVGSVEERVASFEGLEAQVAALARTLPDIEARQRALSDKMNDHAKQATETARQVTETAATLKHVDRQVDRIYAVLVPKGMEK